jgi:hypothetical protein
MQDDDREDETPVETEAPAIVIEDTEGVSHGQTVVEAINSGDAAIHPIETDSLSTADDSSGQGREEEGFGKHPRPHQHTDCYGYRQHH